MNRKLTLKPMVLALLGAFYALPVSAEQQTPSATDANMMTPSLSAFESALEQGIPSPLTLDTLLNELPKQSPLILQEQAGLAQRQAKAAFAETPNNWQVSIQGRLSKREFANESQNHHLLALHFSKILYDFERSALEQSSALNLIEAQKQVLNSAEQQQRLRLMQRFFDVILADFQFRIDNEAMAIEYIAFDKSKDRHELQRLSDVEFLEAEANYQQALLKRTRSEQNQFKTRLLLANELGFADARPDKLTMPKLEAYKSRDLKEIKLEVLQKMVEQHPLVQSLKMQFQAQLDLVERARQSSKPTVAAEAWLGPMSSYTQTREGHCRADLTLDIPLYDGGVQHASVASAQADLAKVQAQYETLVQSLREQVTELYFAIRLLETEKKQNQLNADYADLYLDLSRALYENEVATDLGSSMVRLSQANYDIIAWKFKQAMLWEQLDYLTGQVLLQQSLELDGPTQANTGNE